MNTQLNTAPMASLLYARGLVDPNASFAQMHEQAEAVSACLQSLIAHLDQVSDETSEEQIQSHFYEAGKIRFAHDLRYWFRVLYQVLIKDDNGPRLGQFTKIMTPDWIQYRLHKAMHDPWGAV